MTNRKLPLNILWGNMLRAAADRWSRNVQGSVEMTEADGASTITVAQKEIVPSENYKDGYYIADRNLETELYLGQRMPYSMGQ